MTLLDDLLTDLRAEGDQLWAVVSGLDEDQWRTPTPAAGWTVATQVDLVKMEAGGLDAAFLIVYVGQSANLTPEGFARAREQAMEHTAMPISPFHHRRNGEDRRLEIPRFFFFIKCYFIVFFLLFYRMQLKYVVR